MKRFVRSLLVSVVLVLMVGATVLAVVGGDGATIADSVVSAQVEDDPASEDDAAAAAGASGLPIEQLLDRITPPAATTGLPSAQRVILSRDPFRPVVPDDTSGDGGTGGDSDGDGGGDGDGDGGGDTDGNGDGDSSTDACTGDESETVCDGVVVTLDGFSEGGLAIVTVNGTSFTVGVDDEFATSFRVLAINEPCVTLLFGDEAFSICAGATVLK